MKKKLAILGAALLTILAVLGLRAGETAAHDRDRCIQLRGHGGIRSSVTADGCTSPVGLCTAGVYEGDQLLRGTTAFVADGLAPSAGLPSSEPPSTLSYSGLLTITTRHGTLTTRDTGIFDTAAGLFSSRDTIVSGTGIFAGATGHIFFHGTGTTSFESTATGEICLQ
jgi:hypothetical protein